MRYQPSYKLTPDTQIQHVERTHALCWTTEPRYYNLMIEQDSGMKWSKRGCSPALPTNVLFPNVGHGHTLCLFVCLFSMCMKVIFMAKELVLEISFEISVGSKHAYNTVHPAGTQKKLTETNQHTTQNRSAQVPLSCARATYNAPATVNVSLYLSLQIRQ